MADHWRPSPLTFVDVETTGLSSDDRIVSLGIIHVEDAAALARGQCNAAMAHLIFDPGRPSHPRARKVHGYSDAILSFQDTFSDHAPDLVKYFEHAGLVVAHNASFDRRFIKAEFAMAGTPLRRKDFFCTMMDFRQKHDGRSGLDAVLVEMGHPARQGVHGALEDAWHAMAVYCWLHDMPVPDASATQLASPLNYREKGTARRRSPDAVAKPPTIAKGPRSSFMAALEQIVPLATIMVTVARADGEVLQAEIDAISLLMNTMLAGGTFDLTDAEQQDLLSTLVSIEPSSEDIDAACTAIVAEKHLRESVAGWVRQVTFSDGGSSEAESTAILRITDSMRRARTRPNSFQSH